MEEKSTFSDFSAVPAGNFKLNQSFYLDERHQTLSNASSAHDFGSISGHVDIEESDIDSVTGEPLLPFRAVKPPPPMRHNIMVTLEILDKIRENIRVFAPSESLAALSSPEVRERASSDLRTKTRRCKSLATLINIEHGLEEYSLEGLTASVHDCPPVAHIDVVISGGGLKGYFACGAARVLQQELDANNIVIERFAGASAGAWASFFMILRISTSYWMETYFMCQEAPEKCIHEVYDDLWEWLKEVMPPDAYTVCSGRLFISVTHFNKWGFFENVMYSEYHSNQDLFECLLASSTIPWLTERGGWRTFRGRRVIDGGVTNNTPVFTDGVRRQLVFRLTDVEYPSRLLVNAKDSCIDALVVRGGMLMARFLEGETVESIAWLERKETKEDFKARYMRSNYLFRVMLAPIFVMGIMVYRGTGLRDLRHCLNDLLKHGSSYTGVIKFSDAAEVFGNVPFEYVAGTIFATITDWLRSVNMLM